MVPEQLSAIIVDDERLARRELQSLLAEHPEVTIVGEADSVTSAAALIRLEDPDVVFLDIQLAGESGFDLLPQADEDRHIIFVTAHEEHAVRAFEVNAIDYLLKPVTADRLTDALRRVGKPEKLDPSRKSSLTYEDRLFIRVDGRVVFLPLQSIKYIRAARDYSYVHTEGGQQLLVHKSLKQWEVRLPDSHFLRIHRATIVNLDFVDRTEPWSNYSYLIYVRGLKEPLIMSRRYAAKAKEMLG
jgi:two-component system LytT family response regulator